MLCPSVCLFVRHIFGVSENVTESNWLFLCIQGRRSSRKGPIMLMHPGKEVEQKGAWRPPIREYEWSQKSSYWLFSNFRGKYFSRILKLFPPTKKLYPTRFHKIFPESKIFLKNRDRLEFYTIVYYPNMLGKQGIFEKINLKHDVIL